MLDKMPHKEVAKVLNERELIFEFRPRSGGWVVKAAKSGQILATIQPFALLDSDDRLFSEEAGANDNEENASEQNQS